MSNISVQIPVVRDTANTIPPRILISEGDDGEGETIEIELQDPDRKIVIYIRDLERALKVLED